MNMNFLIILFGVAVGTFVTTQAIEVITDPFWSKKMRAMACVEMLAGVGLIIGIVFVAAA